MKKALALVLASLLWSSETARPQPSMEQWQRAAFIAALYHCVSDSGITNEAVVEATSLILVAMKSTATTKEEKQFFSSQENKDRLFQEIYEQMIMFISEEKARGGVIVPISPPTVQEDDSRG